MSISLTECPVCQGQLQATFTETQYLDIPRLTVEEAPWGLHWESDTRDWDWRFNDDQKVVYYCENDHTQDDMEAAIRLEDITP